MRTLRSQKGFGTLLMVSMIGIFLVSTFTTVYVYLINRARHHARIKEVYNMVSVIEQAAKVIKGSVDRHRAANGGSFAGWPTSSSFAPIPTVGDCAPCAAVGAAFCIENVNLPSQPYCFGNNGLQLGVLDFKTLPLKAPLSRYEKFVARLDYFFDRAQIEGAAALMAGEKPRTPGLFSWIIQESIALANPPQDQGQGQGEGESPTNQPGTYKGRRLGASDKAPSGGSLGSVDVAPDALRGPNCVANPTEEGCRICSAGGQNLGSPPCINLALTPHWLPHDESGHATADIKQAFSIE